MMLLILVHAAAQQTAMSAALFTSLRPDQILSTLGLSLSVRPPRPNLGEKGKKRATLEPG